MVDGTFVTAINCMDGRVQEPVLEWMKQRLGADYVDMITEPGPDKIMAEGSVQGLESIRNRVKISVEKHASRVVAMVAHHDCAGFPVARDVHLAALRTCVETIGSWDLPVRRIALWVGETWRAELIYDSEAAATE